MKSEHELRQNIKDSIRTRTTFAVKDVHTFMRAKSCKELRAISNDFEDLGGGNFLSAMAGIVLLESMSITLMCLDDKSKIVRESDINSLMQARSEYRTQTGTSRTRLDALKLQTLRIGTAKDLEGAIRNLEARFEAKSGLNLGYRAAAKQTTGLWNLMRNNLAHRFAPGWGAAAAGVNPGWLPESSTLAENREWFSKYDQPVFGHHDNGTAYVMGEFLVLTYLPRIAEWLCDQLDQCGDLESLQLAAENNLVSID